MDSSARLDTWIWRALAFTILALIVALLVAPREAQAHSRFTTSCFATMKHTGDSPATCRAKRQRHMLEHRARRNAITCRRVLQMRPRLCLALGKAIELDKHPRRWARSRSLRELLRRESTWNPNAINRTSGACGLFQRLPCPWRRTPGRVHATPLTQMRNGLRYIDHRYSTPRRALGFHNQKGWY